MPVSYTHLDVYKRQEIIAADIEFSKRFSENKFGFTCSVCDRLWFGNDLRDPPNVIHIVRFKSLKTLSCFDVSVSSKFFECLGV